MQLKPIFFSLTVFLLHFLIFTPLDGNAQVIKTNQKQLSEQVDSLLEMARNVENFAYATKLMAATKEAKNSILEANVSLWLGKYYRRQKKYQLALKSFFQLHEISSSIADSTLTCMSNLQLGTTYQLLDEHKKTFTYLDKALQQANTLKDKRMQGYVFNEYGILYTKIGNFKKALTYLIPGREIMVSFNDKLGIRSIINNIGIAYVFTGQAEKGLAIFLNFHKNTLAKKDSLVYAHGLGNIAFAYQKVGDMTSALMYYDSSIYYAKLFHQYKVASISYQDLSDAYIEMNNSEKAFEAYKKYHQLDKMAISEATKEEISKLEVAFETEKKERELKLAQNEITALDYLAQIRLQRIFIIAGGLMALFIISIIIYLRLKEKLKRKAIEEKLIITELKSQQLEAQNLKEKLENKKADLTSISLNIDKKNDFFTYLIQQLEALIAILPTTFHQQTKSIIHFCNTNLGIHHKLSSQQENINKVNHAFFQKLEQLHGKLTPNEQYLAGSFLLGFSNKEVASQKGISVSAVKMGRYRLRKKLQLSEEVDLVDYLQKI